MTSRFLTDGVRDGDEVPHSPGSCPTDATAPSDIVFENNVIVVAFAPPNQNFYSIKYFANVYFMPDEVNFGKIKVCEGYAQTQTEPGYF